MQIFNCFPPLKMHCQFVKKKVMLQLVFLYFILDNIYLWNGKTCRSSLRLRISKWESSMDIWCLFLILAHRWWIALWLIHWSSDWLDTILVLCQCCIDFSLCDMIIQCAGLIVWLTIDSNQLDCAFNFYFSELQRHIKKGVKYQRWGLVQLRRCSKNWVETLICCIIMLSYHGYRRIH